MFSLQLNGMSDIRVSLLIPVYNSFQFLSRGFSSFVGQTLSELEIVFVDDASTDGSKEWLEERINELRQPHNVRLVCHQQNRGVAAARNTLLAEAQGEYTFFVDADDWLELDAMEKLLDEAERTGADMVSCDQMLHYADRTERVSLPLKKTGVDNIKAVWDGELVGGLSHVLVRRLLYERSRAHFIEGADYAEDLQAKVRLFLATDKYAYVSKAFYHYDLTNVNSVSHKSSIKKIQGRLLNVNSIIKSLTPYQDDFLFLLQKLKSEARYHAIRLRYEFGLTDYAIHEIYPECDTWNVIWKFHKTKRERVCMILEKIGLPVLIKLMR